MKSRLEKVYDKLPKQKVSLKKVSLSRLDDLDSESVDVLRNADELRDIIQQVESLKNEFNSRFDDVQSSYENLNEQYDELFTAANELGADDLASKSFQAQNKLTADYGANWDGDTLQFFRR